MQQKKRGKRALVSDRDDDAPGGIAARFNGGGRFCGCFNGAARIGFAIFLGGLMAIELTLDFSCQILKRRAPEQNGQRQIQASELFDPGK